MAIKKKLIRVEPVKGLYRDSAYEVKVSANITFAFAGPGEIEKDGIKYREQVSSFFACREQLTEVPRQFLHNYDTIGGFKLGTSEIDMTKLRLLIACRTTNDSKQLLFTAKRVVNILEEEAGWEKSVITTVKHTYYKGDENQILLMTGSEKWVRVPQMVSLITLILRLGYKFGPFEATNMKEVDSLFKALSKQQEHRCQDHDYISECRKHIITLMKNIDKVFPDKSDRYYSNPKTNISGWNGYGGISTLFKCATGNNKLHKTLKTYVLDAKKN